MLGLLAARLRDKFEIFGKVLTVRSMGSYGELEAPVKDNREKTMPSKPHVVLLTMPAPGHMLPSVALGKALARRGVKVTFLSSGVVSETLRREVEGASAEELDMTLGSVVDDPVLEPDNPRELVPWLMKLSPEEMGHRAVAILESLEPAPCCLIVDVFLPWSAIVEEKLKIPRHFLITMSAATLAFMLSVRSSESSST